MKIYLVGYMCSGKSTVGKKLAKKLGLKFCDTDKLFEEKNNSTISDFFAKHGEVAFREKEREILTSLLPLQDCVVSTGGGIPCFQDNMDLMNENGITIYLDISPKSVLDRLRSADEERPLLKDIPAEEQEAFIEQHLAQRKPFYEKADISVKAENLKVETIINKLISTKL